MGSGDRAPADAAYLKSQYGSADKLQVRIEAHERYSEASGSLVEWLLPHLDIEAGLTVLDAGCGPGAYHPRLAARGVRIVAADMSPGMIHDVRSQAAAQGLAVDAFVADAQRLPLHDGSVDRVMANHMLYHVPDQAQALREMRRVLRAGGIAVLATNAADNGARFDDLHQAAAREAGLTSRPRDPSRFTLDDIALVRSVFPSAQMHVRHDAFVFPDADAAVRYYATYGPDAIIDPPSDGRHTNVLLQAMRLRIRDIIEREGVFRVPKDAGCFVAKV